MNGLAGHRRIAGFEIFLHVSSGKDLAPLRHEADAELGAAIGRQTVEPGAIEGDRPGAGRLLARDRPQQAGLAHAVAASTQVILPIGAVIDTRAAPGRRRNAD